MYFDNAATSYPKPNSVLKGISQFLETESGSSNRSSNTETNDIIYETRSKVANLFNVKFPTSIIFTQNSTEALNLIIKGILRKGDHVISTAIEHNSVIRPLIELAKNKIIELEFVDCDQYGFINQQKVLDKISDNTKLVVINHGSNITGSVQNIDQISKKIGELEKTFLLLDVSQTAGHITINHEELNADFLAFTGHKGLLGIQGIGGAYINPDIPLKPLMVGGTGVLSELLVQPSGTPLHYEAGTQNGPGIASLFYSIDYLNKHKISKISEELFDMTSYFINRLSKFKELTIYSKPNALGIVSFNITGIVPARVSHFLLAEFDIVTRSGLMCAPFIHEFIKSGPFGCVRISLSDNTQKSELNHLIDAIISIVKDSEQSRNVNIPKVYELPSINNWSEEL